jgi:hypothetical protein
MRMPIAMFAALLSITVGFPALANSFDTPKALLRALYGDKSSPAVDEWPYKSYYSDHLNGLFEADRATTKPGEEGALDFDPVISGQDGAAKNVRIGEPKIAGNRAEVLVKFVNSEPVILNYTLVKEHGGWKVDDIANNGAEFSWRLTKIFADAT